jgi:mycothiol synthase
VADPAQTDPRRTDTRRTDVEPAIAVSGPLPPDVVAAVTALCAAATEVDGVQPLSEHVTLHLRDGGEGPDRNILLTLPTGEVVGYGHLDPTDQVAGAAAELVVHPQFRRHGFGRLLVSTAIATTPDGRLRLWAHGDQPAARALAASLGFHEGRRLDQLRRSLRAPLPPAALPPGVRLRAFRPGEDDDTWLALNAAAFAGHPEQGAWSSADLHARMKESWFDPAGFLIAEQDGEGPDGGPGAEPRMVGFHWTKVHGGVVHGDGPDRHGHEPIGEVYVVGVDRQARGRGLGRALTLAGLHWLRGLGLTQAMLYVEGDNAAALAVYRSLGFTSWDTDVMFYRR